MRPPAGQSLGVIGCGNMGFALTRGVLGSPALNTAFSLRVYDNHGPSMERAAALGAATAASPRELARDSRIVLLAVKPHQVAPLLEDIAPALCGREALVISIAAGVPMRALREGLDAACPVVRVMPNTLAMAGEGFFGICFDRRPPLLSEADKDAVRMLFSGLGQILELDESRMNAFTALAGSGPAYVFYVLESLAEAGVAVGLTRESAEAIALSLCRGAAALVQQTGERPGVLREQVCSPGGTTIAGVNHLDRAAVRAGIVDAVRAAMARGKEMESE